MFFPVSVSGIVRPGAHMTFIGSSGSGKTTLFNVLNHRNLRGMQVDGEVRYVMVCERVYV